MNEVVQQYEQRIQQVLTNRNLLKTQRATLSAFSQYQQAEDMSLAGRLEYLYTLQQLALAVRKDFKTMTKEDLTQFVLEHLRENGLAPSTIDRYLQRIRRFFRWLYDPNDLEFPDLVKGGVFRKKLNTKGGIRWMEKEDILTPEEISAIIEAADHPMWKCLYALMVSSGGRINREILGLKIGDLALEEDQFYIKFQDRTVLCVEGYHFVKLWLAVHPSRFEEGAWLFISERDPTKRLPYPTVKDHLDQDVNRAATKCPSLKTKRVYAHLFRHTAATNFASKPSVSVFVMNQRFGWKQGSRMAQRYVHLASDAVEDVTRLAFGLEPKHRIEAKKLLDYITLPRQEYKQLQANHDNLKDRVEELEVEDRELKTKISMVRDLLMAEDKDPDHVIAEAIQAMQEVEPGEFKKTTIELSDKAIYKILLRALAKR